MYSVAFKNGMGSYYDEGGCDSVIAEIPSPNIPRIGDILELQCKGNKLDASQYLVREVKRILNVEPFEPFEERVYVYVIKIG